MERRKYIMLSAGVVIGLSSGLKSTESVVATHIDLEDSLSAFESIIDSTDSSLKLKFTDFTVKSENFYETPKVDVYANTEVNENYGEQGNKILLAENVKLNGKTDITTIEDNSFKLPLEITDGSVGDEIPISVYFEITDQRDNILNTHKKTIIMTIFDDSDRPETAMKILQSDPDSESGVYTLNPKNSTESFDIYCDMERFGGGWNLVGKVWGSGEAQDNNNNTLDLTQEEYLNRVMNINGYNESELQSNEDISGLDDGFAFLSKEKMNALFDAGAEMFMIEYKGGYLSSSDSYDRRVFLTPLHNNFDAWHAIRDTRQFGESGNCDSSSVAELWVDYRANSESEYDVEENKILQSEIRRCGIGHWDDGYSYKLSDGETYTVSRHGMSGDIVSGWEWLFVLSESDRRHPHAVAYKQARVWTK